MTSVAAETYREDSPTLKWGVYLMTFAALAFGEYRPVSKANKAANRRIEIVLYPHRAVIERDKKK